MQNSTHIKLRQQIINNLLEPDNKSSKLFTRSDFDKLITIIKKLLDKIPSKYKTLFANAAASYLMTKPVDMFKKLSVLPEEVLAHEIFDESGFLAEDAPINAVGTGNIAGAGVGTQGEPGYTAKGKIRGMKIFEVDFDTFYRVRFGKNRYHNYKRYVGEDEIGQDIRNYGRKNPGEGIVLQNPKSGILTFLKFPKYNRE